MKKYDVIGLYCATMFSGVQILDIDHGEDKVLFRWVTKEGECRPTRAKIRYDKQGYPFFNTKGVSIPFSEVIRKGTQWF